MPVNKNEGVSHLSCVSGTTCHSIRFSPGLLPLRVSQVLINSETPPAAVAFPLDNSTRTHNHPSSY